MSRRNPQRRIDRKFAQIGDEICMEIRNDKQFKIKRFDLSDLTSQLVPTLEEMRMKLIKEDKKRKGFGGNL